MRFMTGSAVVLGTMLWTGAMMAQNGSGSAASSTTNGNSSTAQSAGVAQAETATPTVPSDKAFLKKAIRGNNGEIDAAKLALQKSDNQQVKDFAQKMVDDHTKMLNDLHQVAQQENIKYEDTPSPMAQKLHAKLDGLSGAAFDKAYVDGMVKDHKGDVRDFTTEIGAGKDQPIKEAASNSLPTIKEHLQIVEGLQKSGV